MVFLAPYQRTLHLVGLFGTFFPSFPRYSNCLINSKQANDLQIAFIEFCHIIKRKLNIVSHTFI